MLNTLPSVIHSILFSPTFSQHFQTHLLRLINNSQRTENIPLPPNSKRHPFQNPCSSNSKLYLYPPLPPFIKQIIPREASRTGGNPSEPRRIPLPGVKLKRVNGGARSGWKRDGTKTMPGRNTRGGEEGWTTGGRRASPVARSRSRAYATPITRSICLMHSVKLHQSSRAYSFQTIRNHQPSSLLERISQCFLLLSLSLFPIFSLLSRVFPSTSLSDEGKYCCGRILCLSFKLFE